MYNDTVESLRIRIRFLTKKKSGLRISVGLDYFTIYNSGKENVRLKNKRRGRGRGLPFPSVIPNVNE